MVSSQTNADPAGPVSPEERARLEDLLIKTSRTFALTIPLLPEPTRTEVTVSYLLFRIADTYEDAALWPPARRIGALQDFAALLARPSRDSAAALATSTTAPRPVDHDGYIELLEELPLVVSAYGRLSPRAREAVLRHTTRTIERMAGFVERADARGDLQLESLGELRDYCYAVAGIVGEMLTDLIALGRDDLGHAVDYLRARAALFGEALQLVNILKDSADDATEGRHFLPRGVERPHVFALARDDLKAAAEYVLALQQAGAERGIVAFTALPVLLAGAALDRVERDGPGSKLSRGEVLGIAGRLEQALRSGLPAIPWP